MEIPQHHTQSMRATCSVAHKPDGAPTLRARNGHQLGATAPSTLLVGASFLLEFRPRKWFFSRTSFTAGKVYVEGTVNQLQQMTGWVGHSVLYFGDQIYNDLADLTLNYGWRTGAILYELAVSLIIPNLLIYEQLFSGEQNSHTDCTLPMFGLCDSNTSMLTARNQNLKL